MLERDIQKAVVEYAKTKDVLIKRFLNKGDPDRLFIFPNGTIVFIEFKQLGKKPTALQQFTLDKLSESRCHVCVIDSIAKGREVIDAYVREFA
jgi:hypothetical protein